MIPWKKWWFINSIGLSCAHKLFYFVYFLSKISRTFDPPFLKSYWQDLRRNHQGPFGCQLPANYQNAWSWPAIFAGLHLVHNHLHFLKFFSPKWLNLTSHFSGTTSRIHTEYNTSCSYVILYLTFTNGSDRWFLLVCIVFTSTFSFSTFFSKKWLNVTCWFSGTTSRISAKYNTSRS